MNLHFCTFFLFTATLVAVNADNEDCLDVNGNRGTCINIRDCSKIINLVKESQSSIADHLAALQVVRQISCGFENRDPKVCCSLEVNPSAKNELTPSDSPFNANVNKSPTPYNTNTVVPAANTHSATVPITSTPENLTQAPSTTTPSSTTVAPSSTTTDRTHEKLKLLPDNCGFVLSFKFFHGNATDIGDFPWTSLVEYNTPSGKRFGCGGALISDRYVLTAAHCVTGLQPSWSVSGVRLGEYNISSYIDCLPDGQNGFYCADKPFNVAIEKIIVHQGFESSDPNRYHDIALLRLAHKVRFNYYVEPICLPLVQPPIPQRYYTSGWSTNNVRNGTEMKYMSYLTLGEPKACQVKYKSENITLSPYQICAGTQSTDKPCIGDDGGPLMGIEERPDSMKRVAAFGVLSMNRPSDTKCAGAGWPAVYTKVIDYMPWILYQLEE